MESATITDESKCIDCHRLAEADHRIANHLAMLGSYIRLKSATLVKRKTHATPAEALLLLKAIGVQIDAVSTLHRMLALQGISGTVNLATYLATVCDALRSAMAGDVDIVEDFEPGCALSANDMLPVAQIVTEVMTNAIKHGQGTSGAVSLNVSCRLNDDGAILIAVSDTGPGLPSTSQDGHQGLGFKIVDRLTAQVNGTVTYLSEEQGLTVRLILPGAAS